MNTSPQQWLYRLNRKTTTFAAILFLTLIAPIANADENPSAGLAQAANIFIALLTGETEDFQQDIKTIEDQWDNSLVPMTLESIRFTNSQLLRDELVRILEGKTGESFGLDLDSWFRWLWNQPEQRHPHYASFKSQLYRFLDPVFAGYFDDNRETTVRLDEIRWGGVVQDGIPPLRQPKMIDAAKADYLTQSLWSTTRGEPTVGPLVGQGIQLQRSYVVTSTWDEWRKRHPDTQVLSLNTGHQRNYGEGVAYADYFGTDELMFTVPKTDDRLPNKAEILALWFPDKSDHCLTVGPYG